MSNDKLWRPGTEVPEQYGTKALLAVIEPSPDGGRRARLIEGTAVWPRFAGDTALACWRASQWQPGYDFAPASTFFWLPVDALTDILIAEYYIETI